MKIYEYNGKHYCEEDISFEDEDYAGDLYDLYWELRKDEKCDECCFVDGINKSKEIAQEVAEEYNNGWIPCSERLPDADENVLTCSEYGFITVSSCNDAGEFSSYADEYCIKHPKPKVIAWQPLPEPYQSKGE